MKLKCVAILLLSFFSVAAWSVGENATSNSERCESLLVANNPAGKLTTGFVNQREGLPLYYQLSKTKKRAKRGLLVIANGLEYNLDNYDGLVIGMNRIGYDVLVYAHRGQHQSLEEAKRRNLKIEAFDVANLANDLEDLLEDLKIKTPFHLSSLSFGAAAAAEFAFRHPERLRSLSFMAPLISVPVMYSSYREMQSAFSFFSFMNPFAEDLTSPYERMQSAVMNFDLNKYKFEVPVALFLAEQDQVLLEQQQAKYWEKTLEPQGGIMVKVKDSNHSIPTSALVQFATDFVPFLEKYSGR